jgi:hypothetical protein
VILSLDEQAGFVEIGEQNYSKHGWETFRYARRLVLKIANGKYHLTNQTYGKKYPKVKEHSDSEDSDEEGIVGWKRINRPLKYKREDCEYEQKRVVHKFIPPYNTLVGMNFNTPAYSNAHWQIKDRREIKKYNGCVPKEQTGLAEDLYTGLRWQCVEYSRRFLIYNFGVTFGDIQMACQMFTDLPNYYFIEDKENTRPFVNIPNDADEPPKAGDLIISAKSKN